MPATPAPTPAAPVKDPNLPDPVPGDALGVTKPEDILNTSVALDELLKTAEGNSDEPEEPAAPEVPPVVPATPPTDPVVPPVVPEVTPAVPEVTPVVEEDFNKIELPPYTKPKSVEAFSKVKTLAQQRINAVEKEKQELSARLAEKEAELETRAEAKLDDATEKELKELRDFRLKFDVEADPSFNEWDTAIKENEELIYARLKQSGVDDAALAKIKELGGPAVLDWDSFAAKFPPQLKRYIETKLFENEDLGEKKKKAIAEAKTHAAEFVRTRQEQIYKGTEGRQKDTASEFEALRPNITWLKPVPVTAAMSADDKAKADANNQLVQRVETDLQEALTDDSPRMRAILIAGFAQLMRLRADFEGVKASHTAEITKLTATIAEKEAFIKRIKNSTTGRLSSAAPSAAEAAKSKSKIDLNEDPGSALDRLHREITAQA